MGSVSSNDLITVLSALEFDLLELGYHIDPRGSLEAFQNELLKPKQSKKKRYINDSFIITDWDL
jgi:hypothetical protein